MRVDDAPDALDALLDAIRGEGSRTPLVVDVPAGDAVLEAALAGAARSSCEATQMLLDLADAPCSARPGCRSCR